MNVKKKKKFIFFAGIIIVLLAALGLILKNRIFADVNSGPYTIFQAENFTQVTWNTLPSSGKVLTANSTISTFAAQGQTEDISFSVRPNIELGEVQLDLSDLRMDDKVIPKENIEVLNLKVWPQCAPESANPNGNWIFNCNNSNFKAPTYVESIYKTISKDLPELLVKNNEQDLVAAETAWGSPPEIDRNFQAILKAGKTHTFYLRIKVPQGAESGNYSGTLTFAKKVNSIASWAPTNLRLDLKVYPFQIPDSDKEILSHVGYRIDDKFFQEGRQSIGEKRYGEYLDFLKSSGFTSLIVYDYNNIDKVAKMMKEKGFKKIIWNAIPYPNGEWLNPSSIYNAEAIKTKIQQIKNAGFNDVYVYGFDEPNDGARIFRNAVYAKFIHESGGKMAASIMKQVHDITKDQILQYDLAGITPEQAKIDLPIYSIALSNTSFNENYVGMYFDRSWSFPILNDVPSFQAFPRSETINQAYQNTQKWSGFNKKLKFSSSINPFDISAYFNNEYSINLKASDTLAVKSNDGNITYVKNKDYLIEEKAKSETDLTKALFLTIPSTSAIKPIDGNYELKIAFQNEPAYKKALSKNAWHHIAGVWDGKTNKYRLYIDGDDDSGFDYGYTAIPSPFGSLIPKNGNRTYIGAAIDAIKPLSTGKSRDGITGFQGNIAAVKIYNKALTEEEIEQGTAQPKANYDFTEGGLADKTGNYPQCQITIKGGGELKFIDDSPTAGKKSLYFSGYKDGIANPTLNFAEAPNSPHLDCGKIDDNYGVSDSITVEAWIKLPNETPISNFNGSIISRLEAYDRPYTKLEDYIIGMRKGTTEKSNNTEFFYSQIWPEYGSLADRRGVSGFYLQSTGLDGYAPYGLDSPFKSEGAKYYDDRDSAEKAMFAVLPSASGDPVITYQFEAFRAGIDDSRYVTLYKDLLEKMKVKDSSKANSIDKQVQAMLDKYPYNYNGDGKSFTGQPDSFHQANRKLIADKIIEMQTLLEIVPPASPTPTETTTSTVSVSITPTPSLSVSATSPAGTRYIFPKGFSTFGTTDSISTKVLTDQGLIVYKLDSARNEWLTTPENKFTIEPFAGYYVYNPSSTPKTLTLPFTAKEKETFKVSKGWNLFYTSTGISRANLKIDVGDSIESLDSLVKEDRIYEKVYIIDNLRSSSSCIYFSLLADADQPANCTVKSNKKVKKIPSGKSFWIYAE